MSRDRHIVAMGGGGFSMEPDNPLLDDFVLRLTGKDRPRVCFVPTASGDADGYIARFHAAFGPERAIATHLPLFDRDDRHLAALLLAQDVIYVGGGNTANMLAVWRLHGVDSILREAWEAGIVLCGISAGMNCWFEASVTDSYGPLAALPDGLGFLPGSSCPHYDGEPLRRPTYHRLLLDGSLPAGYAADDGAAIDFTARRLAQAVASRDGARVYHVSAQAGEIVETPLRVRRLG